MSSSLKKLKSSFSITTKSRFVFKRCRRVLLSYVHIKYI